MRKLIQDVRAMRKEAKQSKKTDLALKYKRIYERLASDYLNAMFRVAHTTDKTVKLYLRFLNDFLDQANQ